MSTLVYTLFVLACGWLLRGVLNGMWRAVNNPHRFGDSSHRWVEIGGETFAFTIEQLSEAQKRAWRLTDPRKRWLRAGAWTLALSLLVATFFLAGCGDSRDIPSSKPKPTIKAWVGGTGPSMLPTFPESALVEAEFGVPFDALKAGDTVIFWDYTRPEPFLIHHRLSVKMGAGWIAQGDNPVTNAIADRPWVTPDNYIARTTGKHVQFLIAPIKKP